MKSFTVYVSWLEFRKSKYVQVQHKYKNIQANDIVEASNIALAKHEGKMIPSVNMVWENC